MYHLKYYSHEQDISDTLLSKLKKNNIKVPKKEATTTTTKKSLAPSLAYPNSPMCFSFVFSHLFFQTFM